MSASGLLTSWRERWRKTPAADLQVPYQDGRVARLIDRLARSRVWQLPLTAASGALLGLVVLLAGALAPLSLNGQILFVGLLLIFAVLIRRVGNPGLRLTLTYLSALTSLRYLSWRIAVTLPWDNWGLAIGLVLWVTEFLVWGVVCLRLADALWPGQDEIQPAQAGRKSLLARIRQRLRDLAGGLEFYRPLARTLFVLAPGMCLLLDRLPVHTRLEAFLAYALPHFVLLRMASLAVQGPDRLQFWRLLHEWLLEAVVTWRTARSFVLTLLRNLGSTSIRKSKQGLPNAAVPGSIWVREGTVVLFQLLALAAWIQAALISRSFRSWMWIALAGWCVVNIIQALARLALRKESALVAIELANRVRQQVLVSLAPGRLSRGETDNFPQVSLRVRLGHAPIRMPSVGDMVGLSVFFRDDEHEFVATIEQVEEASLHLAITDRDLGAWRAFGAAVFSRESDWPAWLAPRESDRILPASLHRLFDALEAFFYDFIVARKGLLALLQSVRAWFRSGPPTSQG